MSAAPRVALGGFLHETNTFAPTKASMEIFSRNNASGGVYEGAEAVERFRGVNQGFGGALAHAEAEGWNWVPTLFAAASPSAHVTEEAFETITGRMLELIAAAGPLDGIFLDLHGAMVCEHLDDGEGEILARVRALVGDSVPVVASLDLHANTTALMMEKADLMVAYRTYPHVDMAETGLRGARALGRMMAEGVRPEKAMTRAPFLPPIAWQCTEMAPAQGLYAKLAALEEDWPMSLNMGFPAADFPECGPTALAYGPGAQEKAAALMAAVEAAEPEFAGKVYSPEEAVAEARRIAVGASKPVVISDTQDNPGAGGDSDTMGMVRALRGYEGAAIGSICDAASARAAHEAGVGATVRLALGGKSGIPGDAPLEADYLVETLSDGQFLCKGPFYEGKRMNMGPSACLVLDGLRIVVTSAKAQMADRAMFRQVGIEPDAAPALCVKSSVHFRADFEPIAERILVAAAPGPMAVSPASLPWTRLQPGIRMEPMGKPFEA